MRCHVFTVSILVRAIDVFPFQLIPNKWPFSFAVPLLICLLPSSNSSCLTGIVGAAICRPRATNSRPYDMLIKLPAKFKLTNCLIYSIMSMWVVQEQSRQIILLGLKLFYEPSPFGRASEHKKASQGKQLHGNFVLLSGIIGRFHGTSDNWQTVKSMLK